MPTLEPYKDGHGYYIRVGYGESGVGTWQIGPEGIKWLMSSNRLRADWTFSKADFEHLKDRGLILNGGRHLQNTLNPPKLTSSSRQVQVTERKQTRTVTLVLEETSALNRPKQIHYVYFKDPVATKPAKRSSTDKVSAPRKPLQKPSQPKVSPETHLDKINAEDRVTPKWPVTILAPATGTNAPRLFLKWDENNDIRLSLLLPGYRLKTPLDTRQEASHQRTELNVSGSRSPITLTNLHARDGIVGVIPLADAYRIQVRYPAFALQEYRLWSRGCEGLSETGTVFHGTSVAYRLNPSKRLCPGETYVLVWHRSCSTPPWQLDSTEVMPLSTDDHWLAARILMSEQVSSEQSQWLVQAHVQPPAKS